MEEKIIRCPKCGEKFLLSQGLINYKEEDKLSESKKIKSETETTHDELAEYQKQIQEELKSIKDISHLGEEDKEEKEIYAEIEEKEDITSETTKIKTETFEAETEATIKDLNDIPKEIDELKKKLKDISKPFEKEEAYQKQIQEDMENIKDIRMPFEEEKEGEEEEENSLSKKLKKASIEKNSEK